MKPPLFVRPLAQAERAVLRQGLRSPDAFTLRRCQILLQSDQGRRPSQIAVALGCATQTVRDALRAFAAEGLGCLHTKPKTPHPPHRLAQGPRPGLARLAASIPPRPRQGDQLVDLALGRLGLPREGLDPTPAQRRNHPPGAQTPGRHLEACQALAHLSRPGVRAKKKLRDRLIEQAAGRPDWVLGFQDETWWTRLAQPHVFTWAGDQPLRLLPNERGGGKEALACYGLLRADSGQMLLRFVEGRPVSQVTEDFLSWLCQRFAAEGKKVFVLVWDNASWHVSKRVRRWIGAHNR